MSKKNIGTHVTIYRPHLMNIFHILSEIKSVGELSKN